MAKREPKPLIRSKSRAKTPEEREAELRSLAYDASEQRLRDGTATAAEIVYWLRSGSSRERLDRDYIKGKIRLEDTKRKNLEAQRRIDEMYADAIKAVGVYRGESDDEYEGDDYD